MERRTNIHGGHKHRRRISAAIAIAAATTIIAPSAQAAVPSVFGDDLPCATQSSAGNVRLCSGATHSFDGTKIDANVILPPEPTTGADGPYPTIGFFHGWGGSKIGLNARTQAWASRGYVVLSMSDRGWGSSCGAQDPDRLSARCSEGYNHLMDDRYEVRDAQFLISVLVDEGISQPKKVGATGGSYGGGMSMALAALRDRVMLPDGRLAPWRSPGGKDMRIAAAAPEIPWTDLAYSLMPTGAPSTTSPMLRTASASGSRSSRSWLACTELDSYPATTRHREPTPTPTSPPGSR